MSDHVSNKSRREGNTILFDGTCEASRSCSEEESAEKGLRWENPFSLSLSGLWQCTSLAYDWGSSKLVDFLAKENHRFIASLPEDEGQEVWTDLLDDLESEGVWVPNGMETYQGFVDTLKDYDIEILERFDKVQTALTLVNNRELLSDPDRASEIGQERPILVFFGPKFDDTGALSTKNYPTLDRVVGCGLFDVLYFETESDEQAENILNEVYERTGRRVHTLMFDGHGSSTTLRMGNVGDSDKNRIDTEDLQKDGAFARLDEILDPLGQIILLGCCNGGAAGFPDEEEETIHPGDFLVRLMDPRQQEPRDDQNLKWSWWFNMAESFSQLAPGRPVYSSKTATNLNSLRFDPETRKPRLGWTSEREYIALSGIEEYWALKKNVTRNRLEEGVSLCVRTNPDGSLDRSGNEEAAGARQAFIQNLAVNIIDPVAMDRFIGIMEGLLGNEPDEAKWLSLYDENFGWSEEDLAGLDEYAFAYEDDVLQNMAEDASAAEILSKDPQMSGYIAGLLLRVESLYGVEDPDFAQEYKEYVELTINTLGAENKLDTIATLRDQLKTPEDYRAKGFLNLPERRQDALTGTQFMQEKLGLDLEEFKKNPRQKDKLSKIERENAILEQIELGNIPNFLRRPKPVTIKGPGGEEVTVYVMPDYMAVGSDEDFVRVPLSPLMAQALARKYGLNLPTKTIVEETYLLAGELGKQGKQGKQVVGESYTQPEVFEENSPYLDSVGFYLRHSDYIKGKLELDGVKPGALVAGPKKELVVSPHVSVTVVGGKANEAIDFYGLYDAEGVPAQRTPGHGREAGYKHTEYALGVRFVSPMVVVRDGYGRRVMKMDQALQDPDIAKIISRVELTETEPKIRCSAMDGPFDPNTAYRQKMPKEQKEPRGPAST